MAEKSLKHTTKVGLYWKFAEQFSNYGIQFIIGIAMARVLTPSDYGITALPAVFLTIANVLIGGGFTDALVRKQELKEEDLSTAFYYSFVLGIVFYVIMFFLSPLIADFFDTPILTSLIRVTAISFLFSAIGTPQRVILKRNLDFKTPAKITVILRVISGAIGIGLAYTGFGVWALVISGLFSAVVGQVVYLFFVKWVPKTGWSSESFRYLWGFGNKMMASALLDTLYNNITPIIVGKFYSTADLGVYNRANNYASLPSQNIHAVVREVSFPVLSKLQDDDEKLIEGYRRMMNLSAFIVFPLMMLMAGLARTLVITLITVKWEACILLLQLLCFSMMWYPIHALNLNILMVKGRSDLFLKLEVIKKILGLVIICGFLPFGIVSFCVGQIVSSVICLFINTWYTGKLYGYGFKKQMKDLYKKLILAIVVFLTTFTITIYIPNMLLQILVGFIVGGCVYIGAAILFKFPELQDAKYMLSRK